MTSAEPIRRQGWRLTQGRGREKGHTGCWALTLISLVAKAKENMVTNATIIFAVSSCGGWLSRTIYQAAMSLTGKLCPWQG